MLSRTLGRIDERIEAAAAAGSPLRAELVAATAYAGVATERYFALLRDVAARTAAEAETGGTSSSTAATATMAEQAAAARDDATAAVRRLHDATLAALGATLDARVDGAPPGPRPAAGVDGRVGAAGASAAAM